MKELDRLIDVLSVRDMAQRLEPLASVFVPTHAQADGVSEEGEFV
jgi:hypothetical protein